MNLKRFIVRLYGVLLVSLLVPRPTESGYQEEAIQVKPAGFTLNQVTHDFSTGQIIVDAKISADSNMVAVLYLPRPNASAAFPNSFDVKNHPCELSKNDPCCLNALVSHYQIAPEMAGLYQHSDLCSASGVPMVTGNSLANPALSAVVYPTGVADSGFLSSEGEPASYTYDDRVSYSATMIESDTYSIQLRFPHSYIADRSLVTSLGSGTKKYEFFIGVSFVKLLSYSSLIDIKTIQTNVHYNKADYLFTSVSSEQQRLAFDRINVFLHQARSQLTNKLYQYLELHLDWNETRYSPASATVMQDSLVLAKHTAHSTVASWLEPCTTNTGYYYTAAEKANVDALALETCLPSQPTWCAFAGTRFFLPLPPDSATSTDGWITATDTGKALFIDFVLRLATPQGDSVFSNIYLSMDLTSAIPLAHCDENKFLFVSVADIVKINAHIGIQHENASYSTLNQTTTDNSVVYEIAENQNVVASGRRLLQAPATTEDFSCDATLLMRYAFDDPANPGIDSVSGNSAGISGAVIVQDSYANFNDGWVRLHPLTVLEGDDFTFTFQINPANDARMVFLYLGNPTIGIFKLIFETVGDLNGLCEGLCIELYHPSSGWKTQDVAVVRDGVTWTFISWRIRGSDGFWSITKNEELVFSGVQNSPKPNTYNVESGDHQLGSRSWLHFPFHGSIDDFRIYRSYLTDAQVAAVRAGGPANTCAAPVDFSCDAGLVMRYAFDDPANPGIDSVSGSTAGVTGDVTVTDGYATFNGGAVRLEPLTVLEGDDITFTWWMKPLSNFQSRHIFRMGENADLGRIQWYRAGETHATASPGAWMPFMQTPPSGWVSEILDPNITPFDSTWSFMVWKIRASDGLWSITVNEDEVFRGVKIAVHPQTYDDQWHHIASTGTFPYLGALDDFRIYRSYLTDEQVAAVRAFGPASTCTALEDSLLLLVDFEDPSDPDKEATGTFATSSTALTTTTDSKRGVYAGDFNGVDTSISIDTPLQLTKEVTFSVWFMEDLNNPQESWAKIFALYPDPSSSNDRIFVSKNVNAAQYYFKMHDGTNIKSVNFPVQPGVWNFLCVSIKEDGTWVVFHNGDMQVLPNYLAPDTALLYNSVKIGIHARDGGGFHFHGKIDELVIFNRALSATEIEELYANGLSYTTAPVESASTTQPILWYKMDDAADVGHESISGADATVSNVAIDSTSALPAVAEGCEAAARFSTADQQFDPLPFTITNSEMTVSLWVRPALTQEDYASILDLRNHLSAGFVGIRIYKEAASDQSDTTKTWVFWVKAGETLDCVPGSCAQIPIVLDVDPPQWVHIGFRIQSTGEWTITVNGVEVYKQPTVPMASVTYAVNHIGNHPSSLRRLDAHMRDFRLYDQALSDAEFGALYTSSLDFCSVPQPEPVTTTPAPEVDDFSCDAGLVMRYAFDDPANPGIDSVSGSTAGVTGAVTIQDNAYAEFDAATSASVRMQPFTVAAGDDVTFSWWMRPDSAVHAQIYKERGLFQMGSNSAANQIRWRWKASDATVWYPQIRTSGTWAYLPISGVQPDVWSFVMWRIRADGYWSVIINDEEKYSGVQHTFASQLYDDSIHHMGISNNNPTYPGGLRDFRIYRSFLTDEQVAAVRAGGPASTCAVSSCTPVALTEKAQAMYDLLQATPPHLYNKGSDFDGTKIPDRTGNGYDATLNAGEASVEHVTLDGSSYSTSVVSGDASSEFLWTINSLPARFTLCAAYAAQRGISSQQAPNQPNNVYFQHGNGAGVFFMGSYITNKDTPPLPPGSWHVFCTSTSSDTTQNAILDAVDPDPSNTKVATPAFGYSFKNSQLTFNYLSNTNPFKIHSLLVWDSELSAAQMRTITAAIREELGGVPFNEEEAVAAPGAGYTSAFWDLPTQCESAPSPPAPKKKKKVQKVKARMSLPLTVEQFNENVQLEYRTTIAAVAGVAVAQVQIVSITASVGGSRRLLQSGGVDVETEIEDDGSGSLEAVEQVLTEEALNTYIEESGSTTLPSLSMSEITTEVVFFDIPTLGDFSGALSYSDAAIGISFDMTEFIKEASWAAGMRYRVDDAVIFNFLNLGTNASSFYSTLRDAVRNKTLFSIERAEGSGIHHLQMSLPSGVFCDEVTAQGTNTILTATNLDCFYRRAIVDNVVQPAASESVFFYRKNDDEEAAMDFIERTMLGSDSAWANETASAYFKRVCPGSLDASATTDTYGCVFADPGYRWLSRHAFSGLDSFLLSDKTILVLLVSVLDASGNVFRRRLLSQEDLRGEIFSEHEAGSRTSGGHRSLLQLRDDQTERVLERLKLESLDSSVAFETSQTSGAAKAAVMKGLGRSRWQLVEMRGLKETWVSPNVYMRNLKVMLQHVTSFFTKSLRGIEIVSARMRKNGAGGGTSAAGRRLLSTGNSSSEGETETVDVLGLLRISDFTGAPVYEQEISCVFSELASTGRNLTFEEQFELLLNCQMMREGVFSYPANLTLRECGMGAATLDSRDCLAISLRREMALPSLAASNGNSGDGVSAAWVVVSIVLLSVVGIGILVQGTRQQIVVVAHPTDPFVIIDEKIPLHPMHQPVLALKEQNI